MLAVMKRELGAYFSSPLGYVFVAIYYFFAGAFFYMFALSVGSTDLSYVYIGMFIVMSVFIPILTMRLLADDRRQKTDQLTLTAPISLMRLILGKFLSAFCVFAIGVAIMLVYAIVLNCFVAINWSMTIGNILGMLLVGGVFISVGLFISSLTENQMIAAVGSIGANILLLLLDTLASIIPVEFVQTVLGSLSFYGRYYEFTLGLFSVGSILYFLSVIFIFLFLTVRVQEKRRWA